MAMTAGRTSAPAGLSPAQAAREWAGGKLPRVVLIIGAESALREEALATVRRSAFGESDGGMNWVVLYGPQSAADPETLTPATILDEAFTAPMFGEPGQPKVTVVRRADLLLAPPKGKEDEGSPKAKARETLERNLEKVPAGAVLVFEVAQPGAVPGTSRFHKWIAAQGGVVRCDPLGSRYGLDRPDSPLAGALEQRGRMLGLELDPGAVMALIERSGQSLGILEEELAKLALALGAGAERRLRVSRAQIEEVCARTRLVGPFEYVDAVAERDLRRATEALGAIFARGLGDRDKPGRAVTNEGEIVFRLLALLNWKFNELQDVRAALDEGGREAAVFEAANIRGVRQDMLRRTLRRHTAASLRRAMEALLRANLELRASGSRQEAMERLTWALARGT